MGNPFLAVTSRIRGRKWPKIAILCPFPVIGEISIPPSTPTAALPEVPSASIPAYVVEISRRNFENCLIYDERKLTGGLVSRDLPMHYLIPRPFEMVKIKAFPDEFRT